MALMNYCVQCMELKAILSANMAVACANHAGSLPDNDPGKGTWKDQGIQHRNSFLQDIKYISNFINGRVIDFNAWIVEKQGERRKTLRGVKYETPGRGGGILDKVYERWTFEDDFSKRTFLATALQYDILQNCDFNEVDQKMTAYLNNMRKCYENGLANHVDHHFDVLKNAIECWKTVKVQLDQWQDKWSTGMEKIDGVAMYRRMVRK